MRFQHPLRWVIAVWSAQRSGKSESNKAWLTASWATTATRSPWWRATRASKPAMTRRRERGPRLDAGRRVEAAELGDHSPFEVAGPWAVVAIEHIVDLDHVEAGGPGERCCGLHGPPQWTGVHRAQRDADEESTDRIGLGESALVERIVEQPVHLVERVVGCVPVADQIQQAWNRRSTSSAALIHAPWHDLTPPQRVAERGRTAFASSAVRAGPSDAANHLWRCRGGRMRPECVGALQRRR